MTFQIQRSTTTVCAFLGILVLLAVVCFAATDSASAQRGIDVAKSAKYDGSTIPSDAAVKKGLACLQDAAGVLNCFDTATEMADSAVATRELAKSEGVSTAAAARSHKKHKAVASADCGVLPDAMAITEHEDFNYHSSAGSWIIAGYARGNWYNMTGSLGNSASSISAGNHSGYLANETNGNSTRFRVEVNQCERYLTWVNFNDRAESRYRN